MVSCRTINHSDLPSIADFLARGFPRRSQQYWMAGLNRLAAHRVPIGYQQFGYVLVSNDSVVGTILVISSSRSVHGQASIQCNLSSWYVQPEFRAYASLLSTRAKASGATLINISPASYTIPIIEAQGFKKFCSGMFAAIPSWRRPPTRTKIYSSPTQWTQSETISEDQRRLLMEHHAFGCICLWLETPKRNLPFIFRCRFVGAAAALLPAAQLIYGPDLETIEEYHGMIGRYFAARGIPFTLISTDRPLRRVVGHHFGRRWPMYFKGQVAPSVTDLCYTEAAIFGL